MLYFASFKFFTLLNWILNYDQTYSFQISVLTRRKSMLNPVQGDS